MSLDAPSSREITLRAVVLGAVLAAVLAAANAYLGLFAGMTVSASIPAAVVSMALLRLLGRSTALENNIVQTAASSGEAVAAGAVFTLPALVLLGFWRDFPYVWTTVLAGLGGSLGVLFTIPLRRALILEEKLKFPEGVATAEVLKAGHRGGEGLWGLGLAAAASGLFKLGESGLHLWADTVQGARRIGSSPAYFGSNLSPALLSVGYIVGLNTAVLIFLGGLCNWLIAIPLCAAAQNWPQADGADLSALDWAGTLWSTQTRYIGVGGMLVGGLWSVLTMRRSIVAGVRSGLAAYGSSAAGQAPLAPPAPTERDMPMKWVLLLTAASILPLLLLYHAIVGQAGVALAMAATMLAAGFVFSAVAAYMAGVVGSSNNPISGVTIATVLVSSLVLLLLVGPGGSGGPAAAVLIGSVVCCAAAMGGDNLQDLKTGQLVGSTPWKQQVMQFVGVIAGALVVAPVLGLLLNAYGLKGHASARAGALAAPQANLMASVAQGVFAGELPMRFVLIGLAVGAGVIALDEILKRSRSGFRTPVLAVAIGFYLPLNLAVPIFAGGLIQSLLAGRRHRAGPPPDGAGPPADGTGPPPDGTGPPADEPGGPSRRGLLAACGLITGEALMGIVLAVTIVATGRADPLAAAGAPYGPWPGLILLAAIAAWLVVQARR